MSKKIRVKITPKQQSEPEENPIDDKNLEDIIHRYVMECVGLLNKERRKHKWTTKQWIKLAGIS